MPFIAIISEFTCSFLEMETGLIYLIHDGIEDGPGYGRYSFLALETCLIYLFHDGMEDGGDIRVGRVIGRVGGNV